MSALTPVERATLAVMAGHAAEYTRHDTYLSPRALPDRAPRAQAMSNVRGPVADYHDDALDPRREYMVERATLRGAVALATRRREPWHTLLCDAMGEVWREMLQENERATGTRHDDPDVFTWAETLRAGSDGQVYCPTFGDCAVLLASVRRRALDGLAPLTHGDLLVAIGNACPGLGVSLAEEEGEWLARATMAYAPRPLVKRATTRDGAAEGLLATLSLRMAPSESRLMSHLAEVMP